MKSRAQFIIITVLVLLVVSAIVYVAFQQKIFSNAAKTETAPREVRISIFYQGEAFHPFVKGFKDGLSELIAPKENILLKYKEFDIADETQLLIDETMQRHLIRDMPNLVVVIGPQIMQAAMTTAIKHDLNIPLLYGFGGNPNDGFFVRSMQSSGNNFTGVTWRAYELDGRRLEILKRINPKINSVLVYTKKGSSELAPATVYLEEYAKLAGLSITIREVDTTEEFISDVTKIDTKRFDAVSYVSDPFFLKNATAFHGAVLKQKIPVVFDDESFAHLGGLASYGAKYNPAGKQLGRLARKIIVDGLKPTDIPSEVATQLNLVLNENTAKKIGIIFPANITTLANEIIPVTLE